MKYKLKQLSGKEKYWSRNPGVYVDVNTGEKLIAPFNAPFMGSIQMWYESLAHVIDQTAMEFDAPGFIVTSRNPHTILEHLIKFKPIFAYSPNNNESTFSHGELDFQKSYLDPPNKISIYFSKGIPEDMMYYVLEDGTHTPIHILGSVVTQ